MVRWTAALALAGALGAGCGSPYPEPDSPVGNMADSSYYGQPCVPQTQDAHAVDSSYGPEVVFITVMTSDVGGYGDPATVATAAKWASRFGLDPERVLAADLTAMTIPKHLLFSPDGHLLFEKTGQMRASEMRDVLVRYMADWRQWKETGWLAEWMTWEES